MSFKQEENCDDDGDTLQLEEIGARVEGEEETSPTKSTEGESVIFTKESFENLPTIRQGEYLRTTEGETRTHFVYKAGQSRPYFLKGIESMLTTVKKRCVVFVHGLGFFNQSWEDFENYLNSNGVSTLSYDLIGRGLSDAVKGYSVDDHVRQLYDVIRSQIDSHDSIDIVGHSLGGAIALAFLASHADDEALCGKVKSVHAVAPAGLLSMPSLCLIQRLPVLNLVFWPLLMNMQAQRAAWMADHASPDSDKCRRIMNLQESLHADPARSSKITYAMWRTLEDFQFTNMHATAQTLARKMRQKDTSATEALQVKIIWGTADTVCPYSSAAEWEATFEGVENFEMISLEGRGHSVIQADLESVIAATAIV